MHCSKYFTSISVTDPHARPRKLGPLPCLFFPGSIETNCLGPYNQDFKSQDLIQGSLAPEPGLLSTLQLCLSLTFESFLQLIGIYWGLPMHQLVRLGTSPTDTTWAQASSQEQAHSLLWRTTGLKGETAQWMDTAWLFVSSLWKG